jgi:hypothetical protein
MVQRAWLCFSPEIETGQRAHSILMLQFATSRSLPLSAYRRKLDILNTLLQFGTLSFH